jgi:hypothetical protein
METVTGSVGLKRMPRDGRRGTAHTCGTVAASALDVSRFSVGTPGHDDALWHVSKLHPTSLKRACRTRARRAPCAPDERNRGKVSLRSRGTDAALLSQSRCGVDPWPGYRA